MQQVRETNKTVQDLKIEVATVKKIQTMAILGMKNLGNRTDNTNTSISNIIQSMEKRISGVKYAIK